MDRGWHDRRCEDAWRSDLGERRRNDVDNGVHHTTAAPGALWCELALGDRGNCDRDRRTRRRASGGDDRSAAQYIRSRCMALDAVTSLNGTLG